MARQTRAQRRARRGQMTPASEPAAPAAPAAPAPRARTPQPPARSAPVRSQPSERRFPGSGIKSFLGESIAELKKVEWPGQNQLIQGVAVVIVACVIVGVYLYAADLVFKRLVQDVLLK